MLAQASASPSILLTDESRDMPPIRRWSLTDKEFDMKYDKCEELWTSSCGITYVVCAKGDESRRGRYACREILLPPAEAAAISIAISAEDESAALSAEARKLMNELGMLTTLRSHPNLIELRDFSVEGGVCRLVLSLLTGGQLNQSLAERGSLAEGDAKGAITGVLKGVEHMHSKGVAHRDLNLENIVLVDELSTYEHVKITGLSSAKRLLTFGGDSRRRERATTTRGSPLFMAPEVARSLQEEQDSTVVSCCGLEADLWSCGVILYMLLSGYPPFDADSGTRHLFNQIRAGAYSLEDDPVWELISEEAKDLVRKLLTVDPSKRIVATDALRHPWLKDARGC